MSFWSRLFRRKPEPPAPRERPRSTEKWAAGDLAVCIDDDWDINDPCVAGDISKGDLNRVQTVVIRTASRGGIGEFLTFTGKPSNKFYESFAFRKADQDAEPAEAEFTALIKRPVRKRERA